MGCIMRILVYEGEGTSSFCLSETRSLFRGALQEVQMIDANDLIATNWEKTTSLLVFPGGRDVPYDRALKGVGTAKIRKFVKMGGHFLGICAGAYFASASVIFEVGTPLEVQEKRDLKFFPGLAVGALYPETPFCYQSEQGAHPAFVSFLDSQLHVYYNGGCCFQGAEQASCADVLGHFIDRENLAAIIRCKVGKGKAILSGVHFEVSGAAAQERGAALKVIEMLKASEKKRQKLIDTILSELL